MQIFRLGGGINAELARPGGSPQKVLLVTPSQSVHVDLMQSESISARRSATVLALFIGVTFIAPLLAVWSPPGEWYASLKKPEWNPPSWIFGPVWTALYLAMATAAWLVWRRGGWRAQRKALVLYTVQLAINAAWSPLFFGLKMPALAFVEILLLLASVIVCARAFSKVERAAGLLFAPYIAWVAFAAFLNFTLWRLN